METGQHSRGSHTAHKKKNRHKSSAAAVTALLFLVALVLFLVFGRGFLFKALDRAGLCPHAWQDGVCIRCGRLCEHSVWKDGVCTVCGEVCVHEFRWNESGSTAGGNTVNGNTDNSSTFNEVNVSGINNGDSVCIHCGTVCTHNWTAEGVCSICGKACSHHWTDGTCAVCGAECAHVYADSVCTVCGMACAHEWTDGTCALCGAECTHNTHDPETRLCPVCGSVCAHRCVNGVCSLCGKEMPFVTGYLPDDVFSVTQTGTLYEARYTTWNYDYEKIYEIQSEPIEKTMLVYLPAGYDPAKQYNVLFLLHGNYGWTYDWLGNMNSFRNQYVCGKDLLDGIIEHGYCEPLIVISLTYYTTTVEDGPVCGDAVFNREMLQDILPAVVRQFPTYAENDTPEAIAAARNHFGIAGLSDGALYVLRLMAAAPENFAWFGCYSGNNGTKDVAEALNSSGLDIGYFITGAGSEDGQRGNVENEFVWFQERTDKIRDGENAACIIVQEAGHSWSTWYTMLYNTLLVFFHET